VLEQGDLMGFEKVVPQSNHQSLGHFVLEFPWKGTSIIGAIQGRVGELVGDAQEGSVHLDGVGFVKSGSALVGVHRQYGGHVGKVENCQVGVFLGYVRGSFRVLIDHRLYLGEAWVEDAVRRERCGVSEGVGYQSQGELGLERLLEAKGRGFPLGWVGMDRGYGSKPWLLARLEQEGIEYMADVPCDTRVWLSTPKVGVPPGQGKQGGSPSQVRVLAGEEKPVEVRELVKRIAQEEWEWYYVRDTERGELWSPLAFLRGYPVREGLPGPERWLVLGREEGEKLKSQVSKAPKETSRSRLAGMSHSRYGIERAIQDARGEAGMGEDQVRGWVGWHHPRTRVLLAMLFLLELQFTWKEQAPQLTVQEVREILEGILPRREITAEEIIRLLEQKHKARRSARNSHPRRQKGKGRKGGGEGGKGK
jgi:SRSO17 transposase